MVVLWSSGNEKKNLAQSLIWSDSVNPDATFAEFINFVQIIQTLLSDSS